ncbi:MAG: hypothetical protein HQL97_02040 [Magnetococcales bacterium]|nr:hypothetical protein [Magnetococcales bacterium]
MQYFDKNMPFLAIKHHIFVYGSKLALIFCMGKSHHPPLEAIMSHSNARSSGKSKRSERSDQKDKKSSKKKGNQDLNTVRPSSGNDAAIVGVPTAE